MKHSKQQFDKLRKQSHERKVENDALKEEIEKLRNAPPGHETQAANSEELEKLQALLNEALSQKCVVGTREVSVEVLCIVS